MQQLQLLSVREAANYLEISEALVRKFIQLGLIVPSGDVNRPQLNNYAIRRLMQVVDLYEKSYTPESIEYILNS